ncbi:MAG TPA: NlpC/P60 family protein [Mycobacteriales bacterium]|nr:NlpC/P60 family protein [Mycobacteriales bacterium]
MSVAVARPRLWLLIVLFVALLTPVVGAGSTASAAPTLGERAVAEAKRHVGKSYKWGAAGPSRFDCSGFTMYVFARLGKSLPHNSAAQSRAVPRIANSAKRPGDLIFTRRSNGSIGHVGIYAGGTDMWASVQSGDVVRRQSFARRSYSVGRVG